MMIMMMIKMMIMMIIIIVIIMKSIKEHGRWVGVREVAG